MKDKIKIFFGICIFLTISFVWFKYFTHKTINEIYLECDPLVSVEYLSKENAISEKKIERGEKLFLTSKVFAYDHPEIEKAKIVTDISYERFSDYTVLFAGDRQEFYSIASMENVGDDKDNYLSTILEDKKNQKFIKIDPNQTYDIYVFVENQYSNDLKYLNINNKDFIVSKVEEGLFKISNFAGDGISSYGIAADSSNAKLLDVVFVSKGSVVTENSLSKNECDPKLISKIEDNSFSISVTEKTFLLIQLPYDGYVEKKSSSKIPIETFLVSNYHNVVETVPTVNNKESERVGIILSSGDYVVADGGRVSDKRGCVNVSLFLMAILVIYIFINTIKFYVVLVYLFFKRNIKIIANLIDSQRTEALIYIFLIIILFALRTNSYFFGIFNTTNTVLVIYFLLLLFLRFSKKFIIFSSLSIIFIIALTKQLFYLDFAEKSGKILIMLFAIILAYELFENIKILRKKKDVKKVKN